MRNVRRPKWSVAIYPALTAIAASNGCGSSPGLGVGELASRNVEIGCWNSTRRFTGSLAGFCISGSGSEDMCEIDNCGELVMSRWLFLLIYMVKLKELIIVQ